MLPSQPLFFTVALINLKSFRINWSRRWLKFFRCRNFDNVQQITIQNQSDWSRCDISTGRCCSICSCHFVRQWRHLKIVPKFTKHTLKKTDFNIYSTRPPLFESADRSARCLFPRPSYSNITIYLSFVSCCLSGTHITFFSCLFIRERFIKPFLF